MKPFERRLDEAERLLSRESQRYRVFRQPNDMPAEARDAWMADCRATLRESETAIFVSRHGPEEYGAATFGALDDEFGEGTNGSPRSIDFGESDAV
jgi:hypothetical protein